MATCNKRGRKFIPKEELIKDLKRMAKLLNQDYVGLNQNKKHGLYSSGTFERNFGTWNKAVVIAGLKPNLPFTEKELLDDLKRVAKELEPVKLSWENYKTKGKYASNTYVYRFGNWSTAMKKAGLASANKPKQKSLKITTPRKTKPTKAGK